MLSFNIDDLMRNDFNTSGESSSSTESTTETPSLPLDENRWSVSPSSTPESIADILLSLDNRAQTVSTPTKQTSQSSLAKEEKPDHSYIALISMAILNSPVRKLVLADIYQYIMDNFPYYNNKEKAWRNSIRHNLSLNECFVKNGRAENGKGNYWSIHPACVEDFAKGDFRRRQARRRARKTVKEGNNRCYSPMNYGYNVSYVPMTSYPVGYHPYLGVGPGVFWSPSQISRGCYPSVNSQNFSLCAPGPVTQRSPAIQGGIWTPS